LVHKYRPGVRMTHELASLATRRGAETPHRNGAYWLTKRRDGRSDVWVVAWYQPRGRLVRYRSTRTRDLNDAKRFLDTHAAANPITETYSVPTPRLSRFVYFVGGDVGGIKIGIALDPQKRLIDLQCGSPIKLRILAVREGGRSVELAYHRQFAAHRLHGEWFERHPDILAEIDRLTPRRSPPPTMGGR